MRLEAIALRSFSPFRQQVLQFGASVVEDKPADTHIFVGENGTGKTRLLALMMAACGNATEINERGGPGDSFVLASMKGQHWLWNASVGAVKDSRPDGVDARQRFDNFLERGKAATLGRAGHQHLAAAVMNTPALAFKVGAAIRDEKVQPLAGVEWGGLGSFLLFNPPGKEYASLAQAITNIKIRVGMYIASGGGGQRDRTAELMFRLEESLTKITGRPFTFVVQQPDDALRLRVRWGGTEMSFQQLPDGLRAVIGWMASCVAKLDALLQKSDRPLDQRVILFLDEPETNLHPAWQRKILPALQLLLPNAQIFVATHSPFVVSSVNEGWIYILKAHKDGGVEVAQPQPCSKGDSYIDAVEDVLGLREWYDPETEELLTRFRQLRDTALRTLSDADLNSARTLADQIAKRSRSLEQMMGRELKQLAAKERVAMH